MSIFLTSRNKGSSDFRGGVIRVSRGDALHVAIRFQSLLGGLGLEALRCFKGLGLEVASDMSHSLNS